jgi:hypothetical protein
MACPRRAAPAATLTAACLLSPLTAAAPAVGGEDARPVSSQASGSGDGSTPWGAVTALFGGSAVLAAAGVLALGRHRPEG